MFKKEWKKYKGNELRHTCHPEWRDETRDSQLVTLNKKFNKLVTFVRWHFYKSYFIVMFTYKKPGDTQNDKQREIKQPPQDFLKQTEFIRL
jgi:hypothetical protein